MSGDGRVVVLGASGFVGSHVVRVLRAADVEVLPLSRRDADVTDERAVRSRLEAGDTVVNAAGYAAATDRSAAGRARFQRANVEGALAIQRAAEAASAAQLIHLSSIAAMGVLQGGRFDETATGPCVSAYARSKRDAEAALRAAATRVPLTLLRPTSVFGEGRGLMRTLCALATKPVVPLPAGGRGRIPFCHVENVGHAVRLCVRNPAAFQQVFLVADRRSYSLAEIMHALTGELGTSPRYLSVPRPLAMVAAGGLEYASVLAGGRPLIDRARMRTLTGDVEFSIERIQRAVGYEPGVSMPEAVARIARWWTDTGREGQAA